MKLLLAFQYDHFSPDFIGHAIDVLRRNHIDVLTTLHQEAILSNSGLSFDDSANYIDPETLTCDGLLYLQAVDQADGELVPWQFAWANNHQRPIIVFHGSQVQHLNLVRLAHWEILWHRPDEIIDSLGAAEFRSALRFLVPAKPQHPSRGKRLAPPRNPA